MNPELEIAFVERHFRRDARARNVRLLEQRKGRDRVWANLWHLVHVLEGSHLHEITEPAVDAGGAVQHLTRRGARGPCYVVSEEPGLDGVTLELRAAVEATLAHEATLAIDEKTLVALYHGELREGTFVIA